MPRLLLLIITLVTCRFLLAAEEEIQPAPPLDPKYMGQHGMVLVNNGSTIFASLLPSYREPNNMQLVYSVESKNVPLMHLVRDAELVTILPEPFNLQHLIRNEKLTIKGDVYMGHYDRGGMAVYKDFELNLDSQLYLRSLAEPDKSHIRQKYDTILLPNNHRLLIHQIQTAPSYDQLLFLFDDVNCITEFAAPTAVPSPSETYLKLGFCGSMKPLYYDAQSFQQ